jgi:hypothetical protein
VRILVARSTPLVSAPPGVRVPSEIPKDFRRTQIFSFRIEKIAEFFDALTLRRLASEGSVFAEKPGDFRMSAGGFLSP